MDLHVSRRVYTFIIAFTDSACMHTIVDTMSCICNGNNYLYTDDDNAVPIKLCQETTFTLNMSCTMYFATIYLTTFTLGPF